MAFDDTKKVAIKVAVDFNDMNKLNDAVEKLEAKMKKLDPTNKYVSKSFKDINGAIKEVTITARNTQGEITKLTTGIKNIGGKEQTIAVTKELGKMNNEVKKGTSFTGELVKALKHAAVVAPIWMVVRGAIQQVTQAAKAGAEEVTKLDYALRRAALVAGQGGLQWAQSDLAKAAGETQAKYGVAGSEFATVSEKLLTAGIGREESIAGTRAALEDAIMTGEDAVKTAELLAVVYNTLGKTISGTAKESDKFNKITGITAVLNESNRISMKDYTDALLGASSILATANVKFEDAAAIIATLSQAGMSGSQIATSLKQLFTALEKSPQTLERQFRVTIDASRNYTQQLLDLLDAVAKKEAEGKGFGTDILQTYSIFDVRSSKSFKSLSVFMDQLKANLQLVGKTAGEIEKIRSEKLETMTDSLKVAFAKLDVAKTELGKNFIYGLLGVGDISDIDKVVKKIDELTNAILKLKTIVNIGAQVGGIIGNVFLDALAIGSEFPKIKEAILKSIDFNGQNLNDYLNDLNQPKLKDGEVVLPDINLDADKQDEPVKKAKELYSWYDLIVKTRAHEAELINLGNTYGKDSINIEKERLALMIKQGINSENMKEIEAQRVKIAQMYVAEMNSYSQGLSNEIKTNLSSLLQGEASGKDFFANISKYYKKQQSDVVAGGLTDMLMSSGLGEAFGLNMMELADSFKSPMEKHVSDMQRILDDNIRQEWELLAARAEVEGKTIEQLQGTGAGKSNTGIAGAILQGAGSLFSKKSSTKINTNAGVVDTGTIYGAADFDEDGNIIYNDNFGDLGDVEVTGKKIKSSDSQAKFDTGKWANRAMAAYGFGSWVGQSHQYKGTGKAFNAAWDGVFSGATAGSSFSGYGALIGAIVGGVIGGVQGGKSKTIEDYDSQTGIIASKIDVTNKLMSITNRELAAMRQEFKTYLLPDSAYFAQKANIEDQYAVNLRQGLR